MALTAGLLNSYWQRYNQRRALTGLGASYQEQRGLLDSMMEATYNKDLRESELRYNNQERNRQLSLQEEAQKKADRAATVSGVTNIASLGANAYLANKYLNKPPSATDQYLKWKMTQEMGGNTAPASAFSGAGPTTNMAPYSGNPAPAQSGWQSMSGQPISAPTSAAGPGGYAGEGMLSGAAGAGSGGAGGAFTGAGSAAYTGTPVAEGGLSYGAGGEVGAGLGGATSGGASTLSTVAGPAALAGAGGAYLANKIGLFGADHPDTGAAYAAGGVGGAAAGALAGAAATSWSGPGAIVGAVVGGIVGLVSSGDSVVCGELLRQGRITERQRTACIVYRFRYIPDDMFMAYLEWAAPIVALMRKGGVANFLLLPFAIRFVNYMIAKQMGIAPTFAERMVWKWAWYRCERIARKQGAMVMEVAA